MNFLKLRTSWSIQELGLMKLCLLSTGITAGVFFSRELLAFLPLFAGLTAVTICITCIIWLKKMRK